MNDVQNESFEKAKKTSNKIVVITLLAAAFLLFVYDLASTWHLVKRLLSEGNQTAAESAWTHFAARNIGALVGIALALLLRRIILHVLRKFRSQS